MKLEIKNLCFSYPRKDVVKDFSLSVESGECVAVLGMNGVGKSTMLKCVNKILRPKSGEILIDGINVGSMNDTELATKIGYVSQNCEFADATVFDSVLVGRKPYIKWDVTAEDLRIVQEVLHVMSMEDYATRQVNELSGGERQKVSIARALAQQTPVLLFDEPTSNLDIKNQIEVLDTIKRIVKEQNLSALVVIHDLNLALRFADRFVMMKDGQVYSSGDKTVVNERGIMDVYGVKAAIVDYMGRKVVIPE